jgi:enamine deaminase RidA (YjgF/YER057c/UK114 family)
VTRNDCENRFMQIQTHPDASLTWRRHEGPAADELYIQCRPVPGPALNIAGQTAAIYRALDALLRSEHGSLALVVQETVFFRNIRKDFEAFQQARRAFFTPAGSGSPYQPASTCIGQPPLDTRADVVLCALAVIPRRGWIEANAIMTPMPARSFVLGGRRHLYGGGLSGAPGTAYDQTLDMFRKASDVLAQDGMNFRDVVRTWIYLREMERDYGEFNRARRDFFQDHNVTLLPASTGIYGSPHEARADFTLGFLAVKDPGGLRASAMSTPTLNEACEYGSDFSRGLRVAEGNKISLYVSGTASVDEDCRTAHVDDFAGQVERMLVNVETLLAAQGASFQNVVSAITYLRSAEHASEFHRIIHDRGLSGLPNVLVHAAVCRTDLLCEMEAIATLPLP